MISQLSLQGCETPSLTPPLSL